MPEKLDFITPTAMRLLLLFLSDPMQEFHERKAMRITKVSKGSANKILRLLVKKDFLERQKRGRMIFYKLKTKNPVVRQFKVLFNIYYLKRLLDKISKNCKRIVLFGSCAEGTDVKESDIDLFILTSQRDSVRNEISSFNVKSERKIVPIIVDANELVKVRKGDAPLYERIEKGIVLWEAE